MFFQLRNPVPHEVADPKALTNWIQKYRCIPYYGDMQASSHMFQELLRDLCELSPTYGTVMEVRKALTFGHRLRVCGRSIPGLAGERAEVAYPQQVAYVEALAGIGVSLTDIIAHSGALDEHLAQSGNAYLAVTRSRVGDSVAYRVEVLHYLHCIYTLSDDPGEFFLLHSRYLNQAERLDKKKPELYRVTRRIGGELRWMPIEGDPDTERTVIHLRYGGAVDDGVYYGRSPLIAFLTHLYIDFQQGNHVSKAAAGALVSQKILALMQPDPQIRYRRKDKDGNDVDEFQDEAHAVKRMTTNLTGKRGKGRYSSGSGFGPNGEQSELEVIGYPFQGSPPAVVDLTVLRDARYLEWQAGYAADRVAAALSWDTTLTSLRQMKAALGGAGGLLYATLLEKKIEVLAPKQDRNENIWNWLLGDLLEQSGAAPAILGLGIEFPDAIEGLIEGLAGTPAAMVVAGAAAPDLTPEDIDDEA